MADLIQVVNSGNSVLWIIAWLLVIQWFSNRPKLSSFTDEEGTEIKGLASEIFKRLGFILFFWVFLEGMHSW